MSAQEEFKIQDDDDTLFQLRQAEPIDFLDAQPLQLDPQQVKAMSRLLQGTVQPLLQAAQSVQGMGSNTYRIVLSPELRKALQEGTGKFRLLNGELTGTVINKETGRILGNAQLLPSQMAQFANVTMIVWQVASMVTAQHFLAEINQELKGINRRLDDVQEFLETQAAGRILAQLKALQRGTQLLQLRALDADERSALQQDILQLVREAEAQIAQHALPFAPIQASLSAAKDFKAQDVQQAIQSYARHLNTALFATQAYMTALAVAAHAGWATDRLHIHHGSVAELLTFLSDTLDNFNQGIDDLEALGRKRDPKWSVDAGFSGLLVAAGGLVAVAGYGLHHLRKDQRERSRDRVMSAKRPLVEFHRTALKGLQDDLQDLQQQGQCVARLQQEPQVLLAQVDEHGAVQRMFHVNPQLNEEQPEAIRR